MSAGKGAERIAERVAEARELALKLDGLAKGATVPGVVVRRAAELLRELAQDADALVALGRLLA